MYSNPRSSSPLQDKDDFTMDDSQLMLKTGDSTRSLLAGIECNDNSQTLEFNELPNFERNQNKVILDDPPSISSIHSNSIYNSSLLSKSLNAMDDTVTSIVVEDQSQNTTTGNVDDNRWEQWLLRKTIEDIETFNLKRTKRKERSVEKMKLEEEKLLTLKKSAEQREEWMKKKDMEKKNELAEKRKQILINKLKEEESKSILLEKSCKRLQEWEDDKMKKEKEEKKALRKEQLIANEKFEQKKLSSEESYKAWLEKSKTKKVNRSTYGYSNGTLVSYYDMGCSPTPTYKNPLPWVDTMVAIGDEGTKSHQPSPPLLWMDVEKRNPHSKRKSKQKKVIVKHSCVNE